MPAMPSLRPRLAVPAALGAAVLGGLSVPASEARAQLGMAPLKPCYVSVDFAHREPMPLYAWGFSPNAVVDLRITGLPPAQADADAKGVVKTKRPGPAAPFVERGQRTVTVSLAEEDPDPGNVITVTTKVTDLSVTVHPRRAATSRRVRFRGRGFTRHRAIWGHYVFHDRVRKTVRFARHPHGDCGRFSVRRRQIPILRPRPGKWTLQIDQQRHWSPRPHSVFVPVPITVQRIIGG